MIEIKEKKIGLTLHDFWNRFNMDKDKLIAFLKEGLKVGYVYTHDGKEFHADEVFALALLELYRIKLNEEGASYPEFQIIRGRGIEDSENVIRLDVDSSVFDHHFPKEKAAFRENGIQYATAGLLWTVLGTEFVTVEQAKKLDEQIFAPIDACDNGISGIHSQYSDMIASFVPNWNEELDLVSQMSNAISVAEMVLQRAIAGMNAITEAKTVVEKVYMESNDKEIIVLPKCMNWQEVLVPTEAKYVIWENDGTYSCQAVPVQIGSFELKIPFCKKWRGFRNEELRKISGLNLIFCHSTGFYMVASTLEDALNACQISLQSIRSS